MSDNVFRLPDLGEGLTEATILEWKVAVGDTVTIDQLVVEVETAKAAVEVPIPFAGVVAELHGAPGEVLAVEAPLITVRTVETSDSPAAQRYREEERAGSGNVLIGYGTSEDTRRRRRRVASVAPLAAVASTASPRVISPIVRDLARRSGVDLHQVTPTGAGGVIRRADVERAAGSVGMESATPGSVVPVSVSSVDHVDQVIPLRGLRKTIADKLSTSRREIPDATTWVDVDATALVDARRTINAALPESERVSLLALIARLTVAALSRFPELNATVDTARGEITQHGHLHLGIAAQTPRGLVVPVIDRAEDLSAVELSARLAAVTASARDGKLSPTELSGGTFTLNNYGVFGVDGSTPIINHPEAAILGVGRIIDRPWVVDGQLTVRKVTQISLTFDHRVCDGGIAGGFLRAVADYLENPVIALGRL
ncbi:2-oxo acid dehydrogenase subunit E2 [Gordonia sp. TBRC 11910]|uniref:Dihydrolipoamide acetyltransferase component of pyruvate dehydrogenase complex n=1 Tax=Gordonia asplenii TaxID=2725283 RepID=A0A848L4P0_9ACTN|nr:dihydrolipoamide acetyltransferase family protein [Gordonia asplenii]NMO03551.1 2-oxo acid dehydrogenase subunit E2 [Gordonia asplenii]